MLYRQRSLLRHSQSPGSSWAPNRASRSTGHKKQHLNVSWREEQFKEQSLYQVFSDLSTHISLRTLGIWSNAAIVSSTGGKSAIAFFSVVSRSLLQKSQSCSQIPHCVLEKPVLLDSQETPRISWSGLTKRNQESSRVSSLWRAKGPRCRPGSLKVDSGKILSIPNQHQACRASKSYPVQWVAAFGLYWTFVSYIEKGRLDTGNTSRWVSSKQIRANRRVNGSLVYN